MRDSVVFDVVATPLVNAVVKFRSRAADRGSEPVQVDGSTQIALAWTVIPVVIVTLLHLATAVQDAPKPLSRLTRP